ncbi:MAG: ribonuclease P protein component [Deltaproteobacteria bacterium]|nr:ribonuclease P protein component [Deltaproteobacteria bacterium]
MGLKPYGFGQDERLKKSDQFALVRKRGKRFASKHLTVYILANDVGKTRLGLAVSSAVGNSVERNRIKRLTREFFRLNKDGLQRSMDLLVTVKHGAGAALSVYKTVEQELMAALRTFSAGEGGRR